MKPEHIASSFHTYPERRRKVHPSSFLPAAASALFALQHHADASIIYSGTQNITITVAGGNGDVTQRLPMGTSSFRMHLNRSATPNDNPGVVALLNFNGSFHFAGMGSLTARRLSVGAAISLGKLNVFNSEVILRQLKKNGTNSCGTWPKAQTGMVGVELVNGDLAWIRMEWNTTDSDAEPNTFTAIDWAYDDTPGEAIQAGQTSSVPEPDTTALLALAGAGAAFLRRRREGKG